MSMHHSPIIQENLILRSTTTGFEHRVWKVVRTSYGRWGQIVEVQNCPQEMEARPSKTTVEFLIKIFNGAEVTFPSVREAVQLLSGKTEFDLEINGVRKPAAEWRLDKNAAIESMKALTVWGSGE